MRIAHIHPHSEIYGPGKRFVIWTQGCSLHCPGCWNTDFWSFRKGVELSASALCSQIAAVSHDVEGVTILGGEPFDQASELLVLLREISGLGLSVMVYSGYTLEELTVAGHSEVLHLVDILVDGRYDQRLRNTHLRWRGSENQRILYLSGRYMGDAPPDAQEVEIVLDETGAQAIYGYPEAWLLEG